MMNIKPYSTRFTSRIAAEEYEKIVYSPDSYSTYIWQLQIPVLLKIIRSYRNNSKPVRLLDFACGTGRILSLIEDEVTESEGIDVSDVMVEIARTKCKKSNFYIGNLIDQPALLFEDYDIVTCFRFLLNTEPDNRINVLKGLREKLVAKNGLLVANIHGHSGSIRSLALLYRNLVDNEQHIQMSRKEIQSMFHESGFQIIEEHGFGILPPLLYRTPLRQFARWIDSLSQKLPLLRVFSIDLLYVCKLNNATVD